MLAPPRELGKCGAVWCVLVYILIRMCLEEFPKNEHIFKYKIIIIYKQTVCYGVLIGPGEICKHLLQLKRLGIYFEGILIRKWLLPYRNNDISYRDARGSGGMLLQKILKSLMRFDVFFDQIKS